jgi:hypothetical protein
VSFLAPLFLLGAVTIAFPVIFHLVRQRSRERIPFSSLMFLSPTPPRVTRRSRLEHLVLLLLRCLVIGLLALGFARPFLQRIIAMTQPGRPGKRMVILVDASASMRRSSLWSDAQAKAQAALKAVAPNDQAALYTFDRRLRCQVSFDQWSAMAPGERGVLAMKRLGETTPGWSATYLGKALMDAVEILDANVQSGTPGQPVLARQIVLITDLQEGSHLEGLQGYEWPKEIEVTLESVRAKRPSNAGLQWIPEDAVSPLSALESGPRVRISNSADSKREQFQIGWVRDVAPTIARGETVDVYVPAGQSRIVQAPKTATGWMGERLQLTGDDEDFDNRIYLIPPQTEKLKILYMGLDTEQDSTQPLYFLKRAFQETPGQSIQVMARLPDAALAQEDLADASLMIISDPLATGQFQAVRDWITAGKTVLCVIKSAAAASTLAGITGIPNWEIEEAPSASYVMLGQIDFEHPLFAPFADPRFSDFTKIHFWRHRRVGLDRLPNARVICRFDNGDPAMIQISSGKGSLLVFTAGWHPADSQLALSSKFVPLLYSLLEQSRRFKPPARQYWIDDEVDLVFANATPPLRILKPDGTSVELPSGSSKFSQTDLPGIYAVTSMPVPQRFVVNLAPEENKTTPMSAVDLERLAVPLQKQGHVEVKPSEPARQRRLAAELESQQKLWRWLILAALVVLVLETWLAHWFTQRTLVQTKALI